MQLHKIITLIPNKTFLHHFQIRYPPFGFLIYLGLNVEERISELTDISQALHTGTCLNPL